MTEIVVNADYDGDTETVVSSMMNRMATRKNVGTSETSRSRLMVCDPLPSMPNSPPSSFDKKGASVSSPRSFSLAVKLSKLQASFAEKTAADMEQIVNWYNKHRDDERFIKISQSQSLPDNAIVYDSLHSHYPASSTDDLSVTEADFTIASSPSRSATTSDSSCNTPNSTSVASNSSNGTEEANATPRRSNRSPPASSSWLSPAVCSAEVRRQLEAADHLIRTTQYMADVIAELEQTSSSSDLDSNVSSKNIPDDAIVIPRSRSFKGMDVTKPKPKCSRRKIVSRPINHTYCLGTVDGHAYRMAGTILAWLVMLVVPLTLSRLMFILHGMRSPDDGTEMNQAMLEKMTELL